MRVLLPPSEAKSAGGRGRPLSARPADPLLGEHRARVLDALERLVGGPGQDAARALLLPPSTVEAALAANAAVRTSGTVAALRRYAGVVYDGLAPQSFTPQQLRLAGRILLIFSGLFGVVRAAEPLPDYRVPAKAVLPGLGIAGTFWRPALDTAMPALLDDGLIVDLRSSDYAAMWRPRGPIAARTVRVRVLSPLPNGGRGVVSFASKFAKGRLAAALVRQAADGATVGSAADVAATWRAEEGRDAEVVGTDLVVVHTR